jgi:hypothetical protein
MTNYQIYEGTGNTIQLEFKTNSNIVINDTIEYISNNQMNYEKYIVILDKTCKKSLELIDSYYHQIGMYDTE